MSATRGVWYVYRVDSRGQRAYLHDPTALDDIGAWWPARIGDRPRAFRTEAAARRVVDACAARRIAAHVEQVE